MEADRRGSGRVTLAVPGRAATQNASTDVSAYVAGLIGPGDRKSI